MDSRLINLDVGFNTVIDFALSGFLAFELWQFFLRTLDRNPRVSMLTQFLKINPSVRSRRIWQTLMLSGPLVLSGVASIVKTYVRRQRFYFFSLFSFSITFLFLETQIWDGFL